MTTFETIVTVSFFIWAVRNVFFWVYLWQLKEYRWDRLRVHLKETVQGRDLFFSPLAIFKWLLFIFYAASVFFDKLIPSFEFIVGMFFILQVAFVAKEIWQHRLRRPVWTSKALAISALSIAACSIIILSPLANLYLWYLILDKVIVFVVALFVFFLAFPTEVGRDIKIKEAIRKMEEYKNVTVIAVSGSYGKTSTKEYIAQVLSKKYSVVKTPLSNNTPIGVANTVLSKINDSTEFFVVEMGAYKRGEIAELAEIVKPSISVTTAISDQHIALYGSMENVYESEYELIYSLPKNGLALFNGSNLNMDPLYERTKRDKILYKWYTQKPTRKLKIAAYNVIANTQGVTFTAVVNGEEFVCSTPLYGAHVVENILPAIYLGAKYGLTKQEIQKAVADLVPPPQTMVKVPLNRRITGIDDTFNASPESVFSAMEFLALSKNKRIFVMGPLTELGGKAHIRHREIGRKAGKICDYLILLNKNFAKDVIHGVKDSRGKCKVLILRPEAAALEIADVAKPGDVVLFEGKESKMVLKKLL